MFILIRIVSLVLIIRIVQRLAAPYRVVNFAAMDWLILGSIKPKSDLITSNLDHHNDNVIIDDDAFVLFSGRHEHSLYFTPGSSPLNVQAKLPAGGKASDIFSAIFSIIRFLVTCSVPNS